ncbi:MAG TPA: GspMb/PilO family protein [Terriglobales bacterium]|nr:GspMb/PilO family protein [Terriglobales bacterium]
MPDLRITRAKIRTVLIAMLCVDVAAILLLFSPFIGSLDSRRVHLDQLWTELQQKTRQVEPLRGMDQKVVLAREEIDDFYKERFPAQDSAIFGEIGRVAAQNGVKVEQAKSKVEDPEPVDLRPVTVEVDLSGNYLQLVRFINALERDRMFFIINSVTLGAEQTGNVKLQMKLETYLKTGV